MAQIVQSFLGGDQRLQLGGEEFVRTMLFGNYWTKIRILIRASINGTSSILSNYFVFGVCEGTQRTFVSPTDTNTKFYVGGYWNQGQTCTYINNSQPYYSMGGGNTNNSIVRINGVETNVGGSYVSSPLMCVSWTGFANYAAFDITRNNTSYTIQGWIPTNTQASLQIPRTTYSSLFDTENEAGPFNCSNIWGSRTAGATGGSQQLDTISVYWSNPACPLEISDLVVCRYF